MAFRMLCLALFVTVVLIACTAPRAPVSKPTEFRDCPGCPAMVRVPAGTFQMGDASSAARPDEQPVRPVSIAGFAVGRYEVTVAEYAAFSTGTGRETTAGCRTDRNQDGRWENDALATWRDPGFPQTDRHPVVCVSWADANAYIAWLTRKTGKTYRLLSEAEWEYAARAGSTTQFWWGDNANDLCGYANGPDLAAKEKFPGWTTAACNDGQALAAPVGTYKPNAFGLYDMGGNVWEWTQDCYDGACQRRVLRGGSWVYGLQDLRSSRRNALPPPWIHGGDIGFRVARSEGEIDQVIERRMSEAGIAGLGAAIIVDRKVVWMKGYGFADKDRAVAFTPDTVMNIGSISKTFTGVAMMRAVEDGKLSLDEDINTYLPFKVVNPYHPNAKITLRHLATHTSGITDREEVYEATYHYGDAPEPLGEFLKSYFAPGEKHYSKDNFLNVPPGTHREYSNIGAGLAGYIVELAVGERLDAYGKRRIFGPLRMDHTGWSLSEIEPVRHSKLYAAKNGATTAIPLYELTTYPDGGVRTSVSDLSKFFIALLNGGEYEGARILETRSAEEMLRFQHTDSNKPDNVNLQEYNSGLFWRTKFNATRVGHGGTDPGVMTDMLADLSRDTGVILFVNTTLSDALRRHYVAIYDALWKHADALKAEGAGKGR